MIGRIPILDVQPAEGCGRWPAKAVVGETFTVSATVFREGHDVVAADVVLRDPKGRKGPFTPMRLGAPGTDRWHAEVTPTSRGQLDLRGRGLERPGRHLAPRRHDQDRRRASTSS